MGKHSKVGTGGRAEEGPQTEGSCLGVLDIGSQTTTLALFSIVDGRRVERREQVRVALPLVLLLSGDGRFPPEAVEKTLRIVQKLGRHARRRGFGDPLCVATSAVREAVNGSTLLAELVERAGVHAELLDGRAEARAAARAVTGTLPVRHGMFFDLGGGSLQVGLLKNGHCERAESLPLGSLRLADAWLAHDPPKGKELERMTDYVESALESIPWFRGALPGPLVGVGGTIRALAEADRLARGWPVRHSHGYWMSTDRLGNIGSRLAKMTRQERASLAGVRRHRVRSVVAGAFVARALLRVGGFDGVRVCGFGLRDGVAYQAFRSRSPPAPHRPAPSLHEAVRLANDGAGAAAWVAALLKRPVLGYYQEEVLAAAGMLGDAGALSALGRYDFEADASAAPRVRAR